MIKKRTYTELYRNFNALPNEYRPVPFVRLDGDFSDEEALTRVLTSLKDAGWGGIAPIPVADMRRTGAKTTPEPGSEAFYDAYEKLLSAAKEQNMQVVYYDDIDYPSGKYGGEALRMHPEAHSWILTKREYECAEGEVTRCKLDPSGITMSVVAYELDSCEIIDLRDELMGDTVVWDTPHGNWNILQFICKKNEDSDYVNFLDYDASRAFVEVSYKAFADRFSAYIGDVVKMTYYDDLQYLAQNRRMWTPHFNAAFKEQFGFDPAPYYPALYYDIGIKSEYYTACFMKCRARLFRDGFFRAVGDFTKERGLISSGHISESKNAAVSNLTGDALAPGLYTEAPGADMIHAYMYGLNGLKLASSAAYNYEKEYVTCEIYKNYLTLDRRALYKDAMNAYARGINYLMPNVMSWSGKDTYNHDILPHKDTDTAPLLPDDTVYTDKDAPLYPHFTQFLTRCQSLLLGGNHVCDIAMLYPIDSLHAKVFFYEQAERQYEFPPVLSFADYLSNINAVMNYCGRDVTVLHPEVLTQRGRITSEHDGGILHIDNDVNPEHFRILFLPAMTITSIEVLRIVRRFYDAGGKILATSRLPFSVMEDDDGCQREAAEILYHVFGVKDGSSNYVSDYEMNTNEQGGMALYLRTSMTDLDGTEFVEADRINQALWMFNTPIDIVFEHLPRVAHSGILSLNLKAFKQYGAASALHCRGVFNYIHKRHDGCEVYFVSNTTEKPYAGHIVISGCHEVEEWDPLTGKIRSPGELFGNVGGHIYTSVEANIAANTAMFFVCRPKEKEPSEIGLFENFGALRRYFDEQAGKKTKNRKPHLFGQSKP